MRAMSLHHPWAGRLAEGRKTVETRPRRSPWHVAVGQTIAVHSTIKLVRDARACFRVDDCFCPDAEDAEWLDHIVAPFEVATLCSVHGDELVYGALLATARVTHVLPIVEDVEELGREGFACVEHSGDSLYLWLDDPEKPDRSLREQLPYGDFTPGRWAVLFDEIVKLPHPIETRGYQGLWTIPPAVAAQIGAPA